jgi:Domain of unknown function (DUF4124)
MPKQLFLVVLAVFFTQLASAQQIYKWKDEKGQWYYSDFPPSGVTVEKVGTGDTAQKSAPQPSVSSAGEQRKPEDSSGRSTQDTSDIDLSGSASRRLLVLPPSDPGKPLSEWIPLESFDTVEECKRGAAQIVASSMNMDVDLRMLGGSCISLAEFKPSKQANVIVSVTSLGPDPGGFTIWVVYGRVFNRGQTTARNVVVRYRALDARGNIYSEGDILTAPRDISPLTFAEFRGQIRGSAGGSDRWVETEANWSKE